MGTTYRTSIWLRMETPIRRVVVFRLTIGAHLEFFHRSVLSVVRHPFDDRKARPAIRAVREWIPITAIGRIEDFPQTICARCDIGKDNGRFSAGAVACPNF